MNKKILIISISIILAATAIVFWKLWPASGVDKKLPSESFIITAPTFQQKCSVGQECLIAWKVGPSLKNKTVMISLFSNSDTSFRQTIAERYPLKNGSYVWKIEKSPSENFSDYFVSISIDGMGKYETSQTFEVAPKYITKNINASGDVIRFASFPITLPKSESRHKAGSDMEITWEAPEDLKNAQVSLMIWATGFSDVIVENYPLATGRYSWHIPDNLQTRNDYQIIIQRATEELPIQSESGYFTIASE